MGGKRGWALALALPLAGCGGSGAAAELYAPERLANLDYFIVVAYLVAVVAMGAWVGRGQTDTEDYFLAGRRMHWLPVGISIMATLFSAISYLAYPGEIYGYGITILSMWVTFWLVAPAVLYGFMPFYHRLQVTSAYEYLEVRFDGSVRTVASALFVVVRFGWMALAIYASALALHAVTGWPLVPVILVTGLVATAYTLMGGMRAVIWTDVAQFAVLVGGLLGAVAIVHSALDGGFAAVFRMAAAEQAAHPETFRLGFNWDPRPWARMTIWGCLLGQYVTFLSDYGADQVSVQRYLTTPNLTQMRRSFVINLLAVMVVLSGLALVGLGLWAYFQQHHDPAAAGLATARKFDQIFPYFITTRFPPGLAGLMIAALLAATMSSIDSGLNSVTTAIMVDFGERFGRVRGDAAQRLRAARWITCVLGVVVTLLATVVDRLGQNIIEITNKVNNAPKGVLLGIFILGMATRRATGRGVLIGTVAGFVVALYAEFWWPAATRPNFLWLTLVGLLPTLIVGWLASRPGRQGEGDG